jgi:hypothetical protein
MSNGLCNFADHLQRRTLLKAGALGGLSWLTTVSQALARNSTAKYGSSKRPRKATSLIVLWLEGGPSQLETFDPHPNSQIAHGSRARKTNVKGLWLGEGLAQLAEQMDAVSIVRSVTSKEGDHERAVYNLKTGYRMDPTVIHPAIGSVICHQLESISGQTVDIPQYVSILPGSSPGRGGYLGDQYDAFKVFDPLNPIPDVTPSVADSRQQQRLEKLAHLDQDFIQARLKNRLHLVPDSLRHQNKDAALRMMTSEQLKAFDIRSVSDKDRLAFGDTPFGRSCLAAIQLVSAGVRCVEITLNGWDTHVNNHELQESRIKVLDPAFASLLRELKQRQMLDSTLVVCGGEFGRTPHLNALGGRDHWPAGFSIALAGGPIQGGRAIGETPEHPPSNSKLALERLINPQPIENIQATILAALDIDYQQELDTPIGRPLKISEGTAIEGLFA